MKKILVTGGSGFIGSNFITNKISDNIILNFDKLTYAANPDNLKDLNHNTNYHFIEGDIQDSKKIIDAVIDFEPDSIINFAAESHVDRSIDGPKDFINTNIIGTYELLQASLSYYQSLSIAMQKKFRLLHVSTDEVYGSLGKTGYFKETTPYAPSSPYSASKASSDHLMKAWFHTFKLPILITNCSNNYGPFQFPEKLIPLMIIKCLKKESLPIYGDGKNIRDWIYVTDHCDAIYSTLEKGKVGETYNIGGSEEKTNIEIVTIICNLLDKKYPSKELSSYKELIAYVKDRPGHDFRYAIDSSKIKNELDWTPKHTFEDAIEKTIDWYLNNKVWWESILNKKYNLNRLGEN